MSRIDKSFTLLSSSEILCDRRNDHRKQKYLQLKKISSVNRYITETLERLLEEPGSRIDMGLISYLLSVFMREFITEYKPFSIFEPLPVLDEPVQDCLALHIFDATARLYYLCEHCDITMERELSNNIFKNEKKEEYKEYTTFWTPSMMETQLFWMYRDTDVDRIWDKPVLSYSSSEMQSMLVFLTEVIDRSPVTIYQDLCTIENLLWIRFGELLSFPFDNKGLDTDDTRVPVADNFYQSNRNFRVFGMIYLNALRRRIFHYQSLLGSGCLEISDLFSYSIASKKITIPEYTIDQTRDWVHTVVCDSLGTDGLSHLYVQCCEKAYLFPGDDEWFTYRYPGRPINTGVVLDVVRKHLTENYYSENRISKNPILAAAERDDHTGHISRLFMITAIDQYMNSQFNIHWMDGIVVENSFLEQNTHKLSCRKYPCLIQVFNRFWVYDDRSIYPCDNIYATIALWFYILKTKYAGKLFGVNLTPVFNKILVEKRNSDGNRIVMRI